MNSKDWARIEISMTSIESYIEKTCNDALDFTINSSFSERLDDILSTLERPGSHQLWHIAALATIKDIVKLSELINGLSSADRGGLWPYINESYINNAIEYSKKISA